MAWWPGSFGWGDDGSHRAQVERVDRPGFFSFRWARQANVPLVDGAATLVEFTLTEHKSGTLLTVVETGFAQLNGSEDDRTQAAQENTKGWQAELADLKEYAERPAA